MYSELKVPMDPTVVRLEDIFRRIKYAHQKMIEYRFDDAAFIRAHDELCTCKISIPDDEDRRGILSKARGQLVRMAMIIHLLEQAVKHPMNASEICSSGKSLPTEIQWNATIKEDSVIKVEVITKYIIEQKFALMRPELQVGIAEMNIHTGRAVLDENPKYLSKFLTFKNANVQASDVSQFRLMPPTPKQSQSKNKYPVEQCKTFMKEVSQAGFGSVEEVQKSGSGRKALTFRKRPYSELGNAQLETLKRFQVNEDLYSASQTSNS